MLWASAGNHDTVVMALRAGGQKRLLHVIAAIVSEHPTGRPAHYCHLTCLPLSFAEGCMSEHLTAFITTSLVPPAFHVWHWHKQVADKSGDMNRPNQHGKRGCHLNRDRLFNMGACMSDRRQRMLCFADNGKVWHLITNLIGNYTLQDLLQAAKTMRLAAQDPAVKVSKQACCRASEPHFNFERHNAPSHWLEGYLIEHW